MKPTGIIRQVDKMGRVVIPKEMRKALDVKNEVDSFDITMEGDKIILTKHQPNCIFCNSEIDCVDFEGRFVCLACIEKLNLIKFENS